MNGFRNFFIMAVICCCIGFIAAKACGVTHRTSCVVSEPTGLVCK